MDTGATVLRSDYSYDALGNRTYATRANDTTLTSYPYSYTTNDRLLSGEGYALSNYDGAGRPNAIGYPDGSSGSVVYVDGEHIGAFSAHGNVPPVVYYYDAAGRRGAQSSNGANRAFVFDGDDVIAEIANGTTWTYRLPGVGYVENGVQHYERENPQGSVVSTVDDSGAVSNRTFYDAFGQEGASPAGTRSRYGFNGNHGYAEDGVSPALLCGARFYIPQLGRFLTPDPIGHQGGMNLYAYCDNNPASKVDPKGTQGYEQAASNSWFQQQIGIPLKGWYNALGLTTDWMMGTGQDHMNFGSNSLEVYQMRHSDIGFNVDMAIIDSNYMTKGSRTISGASGSLSPFLSTIFQPANGTQAFIGGYTWSASRYGNTISVRVHNETSMNSFFYHWLGVSKWKGWDRGSNGFGPLGTTYQDYRWTIPVPDYWRNR